MTSSEVGFYYQVEAIWPWPDFLLDKGLFVCLLVRSECTTLSVARASRYFFSLFALISLGLQELAAMMAFQWKF